MNKNNGCCNCSTREAAILLLHLALVNSLWNNKKMIRWNRSKNLKSILNTRAICKSKVDMSILSYLILFNKLKNFGFNKCSLFKLSLNNIVKGKRVIVIFWRRYQIYTIPNFIQSQEIFSHEIVY